jgi:hypothetical protein
MQGDENDLEDRQRVSPWLVVLAIVLACLSLPLLALIAWPSAW